MRYYLICLFLLSGIVLCKAQKITGKIIDANIGTPIPFVSISLAGNNSKTMSNDAGQFEINPTKQAFNWIMEDKTNKLEFSSLFLLYELDAKLSSKKYNEKSKEFFPTRSYDALFWKDNPIVKQTALEESFIKIIEEKSAFGTPKKH